MERKIIGYHQDEERHWVAELECGHFQHVRHNPPWVNRPWVVTPRGRARMLGSVLSCKKCDRQLPPDSPPCGSPPDEPDVGNSGSRTS